ncbi:MAG: beta-ketoacyl synthase N-terminal-like domain-containing protein [Legionellales bacterium]|nr:beta-ketoacyl synthase N-terminal-like domain-containing protein [Legionellales bacterium]
MRDGHRVFITGRGALTACGMTAQDTWSSLMASESGLGKLSHWDMSTWAYRLGGELKETKLTDLLPDRKLLKAISRHDVMGINAAMQAVEESQLISYRDSLDSPHRFNDETGVYVGSPGNKYYQQYDFLPLLAKSGNDMRSFANQLFGEVHPMWLLRILPNNVLAYTGMTYGFKGPNQNVTNHAVGGTQALIEAYYAIKSGQAKRAVVVAYDVPTEPQALFYYEKLGVLSAQHLKPFDKAHDGTLLAEGAAAIVLESEESALARSATCFAEIKGGLSGSEGSGLFSIEADGRRLSSLLTRMLNESHLKPSDVNFVVAHGNGNPKSDISEALAFQQTFGDYAVPVTGFKWGVGHTICASGVLDVVLTTHMLKDQCILGIPNLDTLAPECQGLNVRPEARALLSHRPPAALLVNRGFGSMNACLVITACE